MRLSDLQIAVVASQAGFSGSDLATAVAVALAESSGDTNATNNNNNGSTDYGLFQINSVHADLLATGTWSNPSDNARMAYSVWHGSGWAAWTTYNTGKYLLFIGRGRAAASGAANSGITVPVVATATSGKTVPNPPFPARGSEHGEQSYIIVRGVKYYFYKSKGSTEFNPKLNALFPADIDKCVAWGDAAKHADPDKYDSWSFSLGNKYKHGDAKYRNSLEAKATVAHMYALVYSPPASVGTLPGEGTVLNGTEALVNLIKFITNPHNWLRLGFFVIGGALVLFAAYKVSGTNIPSAALKVAEVVK